MKLEDEFGVDFNYMVRRAMDRIKELEQENTDLNFANGMLRGQVSEYEKLTQGLKFEVNKLRSLWETEVDKVSKLSDARGLVTIEVAATSESRTKWTAEEIMMREG